MLSFVFWLSAVCLVFNTIDARPQVDFSVANPHPPRAAPATPDPLVDCPEWPSSNANLVWPQKSCITYKDVVVDGGRAEVWREASIPSPRTDVPTRNLLFATRGRVAEVVEFYAKNLKANLQKTFAIKLTMVRGDKIINPKVPSAEAVTNTEAGGRPCHVVIKILTDKPATWVAHLVAHELYHCVQRQESPNTARAENDLVWVLDGSANFFEYLQYPYNPPRDVDEVAPHYYLPGTPLYLQQYSSSLFFHYLLNSKWTLTRIDTWVRDRSISPTIQEELVALAQDGAISGAFSRFAVKFHDKGVYFDAKNTMKIVTDNAVPTKAMEEINIPQEGATGQLDFGKVISWTFKKYSVRLQPKQTISTSMTWVGQPTPNVVVWFRSLPPGGKPSTWARKFPKVLHRGCNKSPIMYEFLVVPVAGQEEVEGTLHFKRQQDAKCSCPSKKPGGSGPIARQARTIQDKESEVLEARQQGNGSEACPVAPVNLNPRTVRIPLYNIKLGDVIRSVMGYSRTSPTTPTTGLSPATTTCVTSSTAVQQPTQEALPLPSSAKTLSTAVPQITQVLDTPMPYPPTATPNSGSSTPGGNTWTEDDEVWDGTWEIPPFSPSDDDSSDDINDSDTPPEDEDDCEKPKLGCLIGSWTADKASAEEHAKKPFFRYSPTGFNPDTAKFSASYKLVFSDVLPDEQLDSEGQQLLRYHELLVEEGRNTARPNSPYQSMHWVSTSTLDGSAGVYGKVESSSETGSYETGTIFKMPSARDTTSSGEIKVSFDDKPFTIIGTNDGKGYGPRGLTFSYNCTGDTLYYNSNLGSSRKNYVLQRG